MMVKHAKLAPLWKMDKPEQTAIKAKQKELNALRDQIQEKMTACRLEAMQIAPDCPMGAGMGTASVPVLDRLRLPPSKTACLLPSRGF